MTKVLQLRQSNFDNAWEDFASSQALKQPTRGPDLVPSPLKKKDHRISHGNGGSRLLLDQTMLSLLEPGLSPLAYSHQQREQQDLGAVTGPRSSMHLKNGLQSQVPPPGPLLRKAVAMKMRVSSEPSTSLPQNTRDGKLMEMKSAYFTEPKTTLTSNQKKRKGTKGRSVTEGSPSRRGGGSTVGNRNRNTLAATKYSSVEETTKISHLSKAYLHPSWTQQGNDQPSQNVNTKNDPNPALKSLHKKPTILREIDPGQSLLIDIPNGVEDKIDRLLFASALRCHVPEDLFSGTGSISAEEAHSLYLSFPSNSLA